MTLIRKAIENAPTNAAYFNNLARVYGALGRSSEAVNCWRRALEINPEYAMAHYNLGNALREQGELDEAVACYRRALEINPDYAKAHSNLGIALYEQRKLDEAVACYQRALEINPNHATAHSNLGSALYDQGKLDEAVACYQRAVEIDPGYAKAHSNLGLALHDQGKLDEAIAHIRRALVIDPNDVKAHCNLGNALRKQGKLDEAVTGYRRASEIDPSSVKAHASLGITLYDQGKREEAITCYRRALEIDPNDASVHNNLGTVLHDQAKLDEAAACFRRAVGIDPGYGAAHFNVGVTFYDQGKLDEAVACYRRVLEINPNHAGAFNNLGNTLKRQSKFEEAVASYQEAIALKANYGEAYNNLGTALSEMGRLDEAVDAHRKAIALKPDHADAHCNLLFCLHYIPGLTVEEIFAEHRRWNEQHAAPVAGEIRPHSNVPDPDRRIRVGFISGSFRRHPVGYMITAALEARDAATWELTIYSGTRRPDDLTERIRAAGDVWRDIRGMTDDAVTRLIRDDRIDILVDLSGHSDGNRLLVVARKPAPVQVKWVGGQFNTSGLDAIDYFLSDTVETPPGAEKWYTEEVVRLPDGYVCYAPPEYAPEVGPLPALRNGHVTFGCFNKLSKVNDGVIALWSRLLHRLPGSRLVLKTRSLGDAEVRRRYHALFEGRGIERARVDLLPASPHAELMAKYNEIDIALDPFPYSGGLTTCEALWMGVPVVALAGETFAGRHAASHLHNAGLSDWVVEGPEDYVTVAERWSHDLAALTELRAGLRERVAKSPLCDGPRFARNLEAGFRAMWRRWCEESAATASRVRL
jgi:predicted O-linked N-acetylglucosamine transferase (SPINDLY family)